MGIEGINNGWSSDCMATAYLGLRGTVVHALRCAEFITVMPAVYDWLKTLCLVVPWAMRISYLDNRWLARFECLLVDSI
jgi:hypothetical protein